MKDKEKQLVNDLVEIFDKEYQERMLLAPTFTAKQLCKLGYRKASEVAYEIFAELELKSPFFCENQIAYEHFNEDLAELKKKYTEGGNGK